MLPRDTGCRNMHASILQGMRSHAIPLFVYCPPFCVCVWGLLACRCAAASHNIIDLTRKLPFIRGCNEPTRILEHSAVCRDLHDDARTYTNMGTPCTRALSMNATARAHAYECYRNGHQTTFGAGRSAQVRRCIHVAGLHCRWMMGGCGVCLDASEQDIKRYDHRIPSSGIVS